MKKEIAINIFLVAPLSLVIAYQEFYCYLMIALCLSYYMFSNLGCSDIGLTWFLFYYSQLAFIANRKNVDQHIVLFDWSTDDKKEAAMIEILNDAWTPRIDCQGDQNL